MAAFCVLTGIPHISTAVAKGGYIWKILRLGLPGVDYQPKTVSSNLIPYCTYFNWKDEISMSEIFLWMAPILTMGWAMSFA